MAQLAVVIDIPNRKVAGLPAQAGYIQAGEELARLIRLDTGDASTRLVSVATSDLQLIPVTVETDTATPSAVPTDKSKGKTITSKRVLIAGGAAGNLTVTGIKTTHKLIAVLKIVDAGQAFSDLTSEFTITAADTINNTSGTSTASSHVVVVYQ